MERRDVLDLRTVGVQRTTTCMTCHRGGQDCPLNTFITTIKPEVVLETMDSTDDARTRSIIVRFPSFSHLLAAVGETTELQGVMLRPDMLHVACSVAVEAGQEPCGESIIEPSLLDDPEGLKRAVSEAACMITPDSNLVSMGHYDASVYQEAGHHIIHLVERVGMES